MTQLELLSPGCIRADTITQYRSLMGMVLSLKSVMVKIGKLRQESDLAYLHVMLDWS